MASGVVGPAVVQAGSRYAPATGRSGPPFAASTSATTCRWCAPACSTASSKERATRSKGARPPPRARPSGNIADDRGGGKAFAQRRPRPLVASASIPASGWATHDDTTSRNPTRGGARRRPALPRSSQRQVARVDLDVVRRMRTRSFGDQVVAHRPQPDRTTPPSLRRDRHRALPLRRSPRSRRMAQVHADVVLVEHRARDAASAMTACGCRCPSASITVATDRALDAQACCCERDAAAWPGRHRPGASRASGSGRSSARTTCA